jgi:hypothetical protein
VRGCVVEIDPDSRTARRVAAAPETLLLEQQEGINDPFVAQEYDVQR